MIINEEKLNDYKLDINAIAKFQKKADKYKKLSIFSGIAAGLGALLTLNQVIALSNSKDNGLLHFIGILGYSILTAVGFYYNSTMRDEQKSNEAIVLDLKEDLKNNSGNIL